MPTLLILCINTAILIDKPLHILCVWWVSYGLTCRSTKKISVTLRAVCDWKQMSQFTRETILLVTRGRLNMRFATRVTLDELSASGKGRHKWDDLRKLPEARSSASSTYLGSLTLWPWSSRATDRMLSAWAIIPHCSILCSGRQPWTPRNLLLAL